MNTQEAHLAPLLQPLTLFAVDVSLHAGLSSGDEHSVPGGQSSQGKRHRAEINKNISFNASTVRI